MPSTIGVFNAVSRFCINNGHIFENVFNAVVNRFARCFVMDTVTAISGSSPAFFMRFAKEIVKEGVRQGLDEKTAQLLVFQTMAGTAKMVMESENTVDQLIKAVTSPNGTTEAGLKKMDEIDFDCGVAKAISAASDRSKELSR